MTDDDNRLAEIKARAGKTSPGPWTGTYPDGGHSEITNAEGLPLADVWLFEHDQDDADFIANAREDIPWLIERLESLTAAGNDLRRMICSHDYLIVEAWERWEELTGTP